MFTFPGYAMMDAGERLVECGTVEIGKVSPHTPELAT